MAEAIMFQKLKTIDFEAVVDSAGTANYHVGASPDQRTLKVLAENNISTNHKARQFKKEDFERFDMVIAMDKNNFEDLIAVSGGGGKKPENLFLAGDFYAKKGANVPDPYYGTIEDFRVVYDMLDEICENILKTAQ